MTTFDLVAELFSEGRTAGIVVSYVDIDFGGFTTSERKRHQKLIGVFINSLGDCVDVEVHTKNAISSGLIGVYWCETRQRAQAVIDDVYQRLLSLNRSDGYNCCELNGNVGLVEIWVDR